MCYVIAFGALCAVFAPAPARVEVLSPPAVALAQGAVARPAAIPAEAPAGEAAVVRLDLPEGRPGEGLATSQARAAAPARMTRAAYAPRGDTEAKSSSYESGEAGSGESGDTEKK
uniref:hypothetical protein n=1 Tax=Altererythrobacter segetis TaxID=1104773 RepID=UPI0014092D61|nr:hypothetical protein [Altererythrobacter segetis]